MLSSSDSEESKNSGIWNATIIGFVVACTIAAWLVGHKVAIVVLNQYGLLDRPALSIDYSRLAIFEDEALNVNGKKVHIKGTETTLCGPDETTKRPCKYQEVRVGYNNVSIIGGETENWYVVLLGQSLFAQRPNGQWIDLKKAKGGHE